MNNCTDTCVLTEKHISIIVLSLNICSSCEQCKFIRWDSVLLLYDNFQMKFLCPSLRETLKMVTWMKLKKSWRNLKGRVCLPVILREVSQEYIWHWHSLDYDFDLCIKRSLQTTFFSVSIIFDTNQYKCVEVQLAASMCHTIRHISYKISVCFCHTDPIKNWDGCFISLYFNASRYL